MHTPYIQDTNTHLHWAELKMERSHDFNLLITCPSLWRVDPLLPKSLITQCWCSNLRSLKFVCIIHVIWGGLCQLNGILLHGKRLWWWWLQKGQIIITSHAPRFCRSPLRGFLYHKSCNGPGMRLGVWNLAPHHFHPIVMQYSCYGSLGSEWKPFKMGGVKKTKSR